MKLMMIIPKDFPTLVKEDGPFIKAILGQMDHGMSKDDVFQHIIMKLIESDVLVKFQRMVDSKLPLVMSAEAACLVLGIKFPQWRSRQHSYRFGATKAAWGEKVWKAKWAPDPVTATGEAVAEGKGYAGKNTLYLTTDVMQLAETKGFRCVHFPPKPLAGPTVSAAQWRGYLKRAVHNHWANWCRTQSRRHKERPLAGTRGGEEDSDLTLETMISCEDSIEARIDLYRLQHVAGGKTTDKGLDFLDLVAHGYTGPEAMEKLGASQRVLQRQLRG